MERGKFLRHRSIAEDLLHAALCIVKVAAHRHDGDIRALLRHHLEALHGTDTAVGVEHHDAGALGIRKALERRLARIARGCNEDEDRVLLPRLCARCTHQLRQELQRHVLERARRAVPQLEHLEIADRTHGRTPHIVKRMPIGAADAALQLLLRIVRQIEAKDAHGALLIGEIAERLDLGERHLRERGGHEESTVRGKPHEDCLRRGDAFRCSARTEIVHCIHPFPIHLCYNTMSYDSAHRQRTICAVTACAARTRSAGARASCSPRRPALTQMRACCTMLSSQYTG